MVRVAKVLIEKRIEAIKLRKLGKSYSQIKNKLGVSKSTLSYWLRRYPLSKERIRELQKSERAIEKYRETMRRKREERLRGVYKKMKKKLLPLTKKQLLIAGLFLYWGEGLKASQSQVNFSNSDPEMAKFYLYWLTRALGISRRKIKVRLHLYRDMNINAETKYWSELLRIPRSQFTKPYIKNTTLKSITYKGFGHGTCDIRYGNVGLKEEIIMGIKAISDKHSRLS